VPFVAVGEGWATGEFQVQNSPVEGASGRGFIAVMEKQRGMARTSPGVAVTRMSGRPSVFMSS